MKDGVRQIVGRTISSVVISENNPKGPSTQVFLIFTDGSCFELYGNIQGSSDVLPGDKEWARQYVSSLVGGLRYTAPDWGP